MAFSWAPSKAHKTISTRAKMSHERGHLVGHKTLTSVSDEEKEFKSWLTWKCASAYSSLLL